LEMRFFFQTGATPSGPEVEQYELAAEVGQTERLAAQRLGFEGRGRLADVEVPRVLDIHRHLECPHVDRLVPAASGDRLDRDRALDPAEGPASADRGTLESGHTLPADR